ncbi:hypothetical protein DL764_007782 [Monosporascus ibericus]|uniref:Uncharacterized protein n=1 Tax=Monosporascus ibericus TaxID=155417 RepID=A0A4Q4SZ56_9PEZI|nr:hypothetical protein DL764_007782 [Monosporascus ibericus]
MAQSSEVEILIHIAAPSRAVDDNRYRSLASAYIDFEPAARLSVLSTPLTGSNAGRRSQELQVTQQQLPQDSSRHGPRSSEQLTPLPTLASPLASFRSVLDNANSPSVVTRNRAQLTRTIAENVGSQATQETWQSLPSVVHDSAPRNNATVTIFTSPTRVLEHYLQAFDSSSPSHVPSSGGSTGEIIAGTPVQHQKNSDKDQERLQQHLSTPVIPRTPFQASAAQARKYMPRPVATNNDGGITHVSQGTQFAGEQANEEVIDETTFMSSFEIPLVGRADSEPLPGRKPRLMEANASPHNIVRTSSDLGPSTSGRKSKVITISFLSSHGFKYESLELYAPEPPISVAPVEPGDLITPNLERLAKSLETERPFWPRQQLRDLRPTERGYWLLDCSTWSAKLKHDAWAFLANYVGTGTAGWGVSCRRDADFRWLRTYCWGVTVPHIYLLLYLATQREILFTGTSWVDGEGKTAIIMGARERR